MCIYRRHRLLSAIDCRNPLHPTLCGNLEDAVDDRKWQILASGFVPFSKQICNFTVISTLLNPWMGNNLDFFQQNNRLLLIIPVIVHSKLVQFSAWTAADRWTFMNDVSHFVSFCELLSFISIHTRIGAVWWAPERCLSVISWTQFTMKSKQVLVFFEFEFFPAFEDGYCSICIIITRRTNTARGYLE